MTLPTLQDVKDALSVFYARLTADLKFMLSNDRIFLVIFGVLILVIKGASVMANILIFKSKAEVAVANKENAVLQAQENAANNQANALIKDANALPGQEKPVDGNWDKKK